MRLLPIVLVVGCGGGDERANRDAVTAACSGKLEENGKLVAQLWRTPGLREDLRAFQSAPVRERGVVLAGILRRNNVDACKGQSLAEIERSTYYGVALAAVETKFLRKATTDVPLVRVTPTGIVVDRRPIVTIENGTVDPSAKEGGHLGVKIVPLVKAMQAHVQSVGSEAPISIAIDRAMPYRVVIETIYSIKQAGFKTFQLQVDAGVHVAAIELTLPDKAPVAAGIGGIAASPDSLPLGMFVSVTKREVILWSISQREGTLREPRATFPLTDGKLAPTELGKLWASLFDIREKHWRGKRRPDDDRRIVLQLDGALPAEVMLAVAATVAHDLKGGELFPQVMLSSGFE